MKTASFPDKLVETSNHETSICLKPDNRVIKFIFLLVAVPPRKFLPGIDEFSSQPSGPNHVSLRNYLKNETSQEIPGSLAFVVTCEDPFSAEKDDCEQLSSASEGNLNLSQLESKKEKGFELSKYVNQLLEDTVGNTFVSDDSF